MVIRFSSSWFVGAAAAMTLVVLVARTVVSPTYRAIRRVYRRLDRVEALLQDMAHKLGLDELEEGEW